jgi:hypothetical protein
VYYASGVEESRRRVEELHRHRRARESTDSEQETVSSTSSSHASPSNMGSYIVAQTTPEQTTAAQPTSSAQKAGLRRSPRMIFPPPSEKAHSSKSSISHTTPAPHANPTALAPSPSETPARALQTRLRRRAERRAAGINNTTERHMEDNRSRLSRQPYIDPEYTDYSYVEKSKPGEPERTRVVGGGFRG